MDFKNIIWIYNWIYSLNWGAIAALATCLTVREMQKQRKQAAKPDLIIK